MQLRGLEVQGVPTSALDSDEEMVTEDVVGGHGHRDTFHLSRDAFGVYDKPGCRAVVALQAHAPAGMGRLVEEDEVVIRPHLAVGSQEQGAEVWRSTVA